MYFNRHLDTSLSEVSDVDEVDAPFDMVEPVHDSLQPSPCQTIRSRIRCRITVSNNFGKY